MFHAHFTSPYLPPSPAVYCLSPYSNGSYSPSSHGSPAAVTTTANHFAQNCPYSFHNGTAPTQTSTFEISQPISVAPSISTFNDVGKFSTIVANSGCYLPAIMHQNCWPPRLTPFEDLELGSIPHCNTATSPVSRNGAQPSMDEDAIHIMKFDMQKQQLVSDTNLQLDFYPPTPPSPDSPEAHCCTTEYIPYHPIPQRTPTHFTTMKPRPGRFTLKLFMLPDYSNQVPNTH